MYIIRRDYEPRERKNVLLRVALSGNKSEHAANNVKHKIMVCERW